MRKGSSHTREGGGGQEGEHVSPVHHSHSGDSRPAGPASCPHAHLALGEMIALAHIPGPQEEVDTCMPCVLRNIWPPWPLALC